MWYLTYIQFAFSSARDAGCGIPGSFIKIPLRICDART